jgi:hypothetical protein
MPEAPEREEDTMDLVEAIRRFNESTESKIELLPRRDGRMAAALPRTGREILVAPSMFKDDVRVTAADVAGLAEEARRAMAPGLDLLDAALAGFHELEMKSSSGS